MDEYDRSDNSLVFEKKWAETRVAGEFVPKRSSFDFLTFSDFVSQLVIAEVDLATMTMPIKFAGNKIRDFVGIELTNVDFTKFDKNADPAQGWIKRKAYHDLPCGRFERLEISFDRDRALTCDLTILPLFGPQDERQLAVLVEPESVQKTNQRRLPKIHGETVAFGTYIDIGAGVPEGEVHPGD